MKVVRGYAVGPNDVFCGHRMNWSGGNKRLGDLVLQNIDRYNAAALDEKSEIAAELLGLIVKSGGRFLKEDNKKVVTLSPKESKTKIMQKFRDTKKALKAPQGPGAFALSAAAAANKEPKKPGPKPGSKKRKQAIKDLSLLAKKANTKTAMEALAVHNSSKFATPAQTVSATPVSSSTPQHFQKKRRLLPLALKKSPSIEGNKPSSSPAPEAVAASGSDTEEEDHADDETVSEHNPEEGGDQFEDAESEEPAIAMNRPVVLPNFSKTLAEKKRPVPATVSSSLKANLTAAAALTSMATKPPLVKKSQESTTSTPQQQTMEATLLAAKKMNQQPSPLQQQQAAQMLNMPPMAAAFQMQMAAQAQAAEAMALQEQREMLSRKSAVLPEDPRKIFQEQQQMVAGQFAMLQKNKTEISLLKHLITQRDQQLLSWRQNMHELTEAGAMKDRRIMKLEEAIVHITREKNSQGGASESDEQKLDIGKVMVLQDQVLRLTRAAAAKDQEIQKLKQELQTVHRSNQNQAQADSVPSTASGSDEEDAKVNAMVSLSLAKDKEIAKLREAVTITKDQLATLEGAETLKDLTIHKLREEIANKDKRLNWLETEKEKGKVVAKTTTATTKDQTMEEAAAKDTEAGTDAEAVDEEVEEEPMYI